MLKLVGAVLIIFASAGLHARLEKMFFLKLRLWV